MASGARYADRRFAYVRGLRARADGLTRAHEARSWEHICGLAARIGLHDGALPDRHTVLRRVNASPPPAGTFCSPSAALLVALLRHAEAMGGASGGTPLCPKGELIARARALCEQPFCSLEEQLAAPAGALRCASLQQLPALLTLGYAKERKRKGACPSGVPGEAGVVLLLVDEREGGGSSCGKMAELCDALDREGARFETRRLPSGHGDYEWVLADGSPAAHEVVLPLIVERKGCLDVSASMRDGRWRRQQAAMEARNASEFGGAATIEYLLEGDVSKTKHTCAACAALPGGGGVGGCPTDGWPTVAAVEEELRRAEATYKVTRTASIAHTAAHLAAEQRRLQLLRPQQPQQTRRPEPRAHASSPTRASPVRGAAEPPPTPPTARAEQLAEVQPPPAHASPSGGDSDSEASLLDQAAPPARPPSVSTEQPFPRDQSANFAFLEELMAMADDKSDGPLCSTAIYEGGGGHGYYNGWSNLHKGLVKRPMPWVCLVREMSGRRNGRATHLYALTEGGKVAAARLHAEAEAAGWCGCGLAPSWGRGRSGAMP
ncbi:hypothetical protein EMIHUDRAFT_208407 [Emiliania huxleyi CCMP1516]|uniref:Crossover junction endonuclease MUS81 n=2 Tax=Emiliania huxleyi TaxID=2903 RepID=A0A0D3JAI1_EMIH1|nr:hypothetical protein EMIHUDRAFT_208407 [Emiliania huxleyi CCMP1516]EOD20516.1 hypothetical protein EMIHUDRAFT_208407 [Emiliania huxleyi CCMP1516]|eukprot:XP_005772945.1 hypothetical protein EMIHUDRAFT_208407 [Emiliania huxleyi CCMP1516]